jgi:hypothetical protein
MKSAPPCGPVRKSWECCISVTGSFQNDPRRIAFLSRGGCQSSLTAADREQLEGLARFAFAESSCPSRKGVIYSRHRQGTQRPSHCCQMLGPRAGFGGRILERQSRVRTATGERDREEGRCIGTSNSPSLKPTSKIESSVSRDHYPLSSNRALKTRSIDVVCSRTKSTAIFAIRSLGTSSTARCWQTFSYHLSKLPLARREYGHSPAIRRAAGWSWRRSAAARSQPRTHRRGQLRSDASRKAIPACMAPNDDWSHVCARSNLDRSLGGFVDCVCEVCISKAPRELTIGTVGLLFVWCAFYG